MPFLSVSKGVNDDHHGNLWPLAAHRHSRHYPLAIHFHKECRSEVRRGIDYRFLYLRVILCSLAVQCGPPYKPRYAREKPKHNSTSSSFSRTTPARLLSAFIAEFAESWLAGWQRRAKKKIRNATIKRPKISLCHRNAGRKCEKWKSTDVWRCVCVCFPTRTHGQSAAVVRFLTAKAFCWAFFSRPLPQWRDSRWWGVPGSDTWSVAGYRFLRSPFLKLPPRGAVEACVCAHWKTDSKWKIEKVIVLPPRTDFPTFIRGGKGGGGVICDCTWTQTHTHTRNKINLKFKIVDGLNP